MNPPLDESWSQDNLGRDEEARGNKNSIGYVLERICNAIGIFLLLFVIGLIAAGFYLLFFHEK